MRNWEPSVTTRIIINAALKEIGVPVINSLKLNKVDRIYDWVQSGPVITMKYPDQTEQIIDQLIHEHLSTIPFSFLIPGKKAYTVKELRKSLRKILLQLAG